MSGKRNDLVDFGIVELDLSRPFGPYDGKFDLFLAPSEVPLQDVPDSTENQILGGTSLPHGARFEAAVQAVRNIQCNLQGPILPQLRPL
jgi:hypothetical protein